MSNLKTRADPAFFQMVLTMFFLTYAPFEVPSNIVLKLMKPSTWIMSKSSAYIASWNMATSPTDVGNVLTNEQFS